MAFDFDTALQKAMRLEKSGHTDAAVSFLADEFVAQGLRKAIADGLARDALGGNVEDVKALMKAARARMFENLKTFDHDISDTVGAPGVKAPIHVAAEKKFKEQVAPEQLKKSEIPPQNGPEDIPKEEEDKEEEGGPQEAHPGENRPSPGAMPMPGQTAAQPIGTPQETPPMDSMDVSQPGLPTADGMPPEGNDAPQQQDIESLLAELRALLQQEDQGGPLAQESGGPVDDAMGGGQNPPGAMPPSIVHDSTKQIDDDVPEGTGGPIRNAHGFHHPQGAGKEEDDETGSADPIEKGFFGVYKGTYGMVKFDPPNPFEGGRFAKSDVVPSGGLHTSAETYVFDRLKNGKKHTMDRKNQDEDKEKS